MRIASIDIGTNTILLLIADIGNDGIVAPLVEEQRMPRLGKSVDANKVIGKQAFETVATVLLEYKAIINRYHTDIIVACGTSAVRDAANKEEFIQYIRRTTGIQIEILTGKGEALWTYRGALSGLPIGGDQAAVLDIGGGSTEISFAISKDPGHPNVLTLNRFSFQVGSVRLTERVFKNIPPSPADIVKAQEIINTEFSTLIQWNVFGHYLIGVAGTVTTLACLNQGMKDFDSTKVNGYRLKRDRVGVWFDKLSRLTPSEMHLLSNVTMGRADILPAGTLILLEFMKRFNFEEIVVSDRGVRYGLVSREFEKRRAASSSKS